MSESAITWQQPSHPDRLKVNSGTGSFSSLSLSQVSLPAGAVFAYMDAATVVPDCRYTTVQVDENTHIELNSDLVFINHSCNPSLVFDTAKREVRVVEHRDLKLGDELTFFYPSTEWNMTQPFKCNCGSTSEKLPCIGVISGAKDITPAVLDRYWVNDHIARQHRAKSA